MKVEFTKPEKKDWMFITPMLGYRKEKYTSFTQRTFMIGILCWGFTLTIDSDDMDKFDEFMSNIFKRTNPQMWFCIIMMFIILANLCL